MQFLMILNDGETFTNLEGCQVVAVPDDFDIEQTEAALDAYGTSDDDSDIVPVGAFDVTGDGPIFEYSVVEGVEWVVWHTT